MPNKEKFTFSIYWLCIAQENQYIRNDKLFFSQMSNKCSRAILNKIHIAFKSLWTLPLGGQTPQNNEWRERN